MTDDLRAPEPTWAPDACTLPTAERPLRRAEFDDVFAAADTVDRVSDRHLRIVLSGPPELADRVRDLTVRETECCSFFTFAVTPEPPNRVVLDIGVPVEHVDVLDGIARRARP